MRALRRILTVIMCIIICLSLSACGKNLEGRWRLTGGSAVSAIYSLQDGTLEGSDAQVVFDFAEGGKLSINMTRAGEDTAVSGAWEESGDMLAMIIDGQTLKCSYSINDDELTIFFTYQGQNANFVYKRI